MEGAERVLRDPARRGVGQDREPYANPGAVPTSRSRSRARARRSPRLPAVAGRTRLTRRRRESASSLVRSPAGAREPRASSRRVRRWLFSPPAQWTVASSAGGDRQHAADRRAHQPVNGGFGRWPEPAVPGLTRGGGRITTDAVSVLSPLLGGEAQDGRAVDGPSRSARPCRDDDRDRPVRGDVAEHAERTRWPDVP